MRLPSIKATRRFLIGIIVLVIAAVLFNYLYTWRRRARAVQTALQILDSKIVRSAEGIEYSDYRNGALRFRIRASRLVETRHGKSILQGVEAHDFDPDGSVRHEIRSDRAEYDAKAKMADFSGDVHLVLRRELEVRVDALRYDFATGIGTAPGLLHFRSEEIVGTAHGMTFDQKEKSIWLTGRVDCTFKDAGKSPRTFHATAERAFRSEKTHQIRFEGNARLVSDTGSSRAPGKNGDDRKDELSAERIEGFLDASGRRLTSVIASGGALFRSEERGERRTLTGDQMAFDIAGSGALDKLKVSGRAELTSSAQGQEGNLRGREIDIEFDGTGAPSSVTGSGRVSLVMKRGEEQTAVSGDRLVAHFSQGAGELESVKVISGARASIRDLRSAGSELVADEIRIAFVEAGGSETGKSGFSANRKAPTTRERAGTAAKGPARVFKASLLEAVCARRRGFLQSVTASGAATISETSAAAGSYRELSADRVVFSFFPSRNQIREMNGYGRVRTIYRWKRSSRRDAATEESRTESDTIRALFVLEKGESVLRSLAQKGNFRYSDRTRSAEAGTCEYDASTGEIWLLDKPGVSGEGFRATGKRIDFDRNTRVLSVRGGVWSVVRTGGAKESFLGVSAGASSSAIVTARELKYWTDDGRVRYAGDVSLLSESQQLRTEVLKVDGGFERLEAVGKVRHLAPQKDRKSGSTRTLIIESARMDYQKETNVLSYSGGAVVRLSDVTFSALRVDAILNDQRRDLERVDAHGEVVVRRGEKEVRGENAEWRPDSDEFVVAGNPAEVYDPEGVATSAGRVTSHTSARKLIWRAADDTIRMEK